MILICSTKFTLVSITLHLFCYFVSDLRNKDKLKCSKTYNQTFPWLKIINYNRKRNTDKELFCTALRVCCLLTFYT